MSSTENPQRPDASRRQDYEVGYGRPPVATRFQRDNCCNPRGRPKQKKTVGQLIDEAMNSKVRIAVEGKTRTMTKQQVIIHNLINAAARGDSKAIHTLFGLKARYQDSSETTINPSDLDASEIELFTRRSETVGVRLAAVADDTLLISCSTSSLTLPLTLIRGDTRRMMPVLR
jgi:Family of unknown function (DUF5681)